MTPTMAPEIHLGSNTPLAAQPVRLAFGISPQDVAARIRLKIPRGYENDVADLNPNPTLHLTSNTADSIVAVATSNHKPIVSEHLSHNAQQLSFLRHDHLPKVTLTENFLFTHAFHRLQRRHYLKTLNKDSIIGDYL